MQILIIGGGIAGLTLAGLLRQRGLEPTVVEKAGHYGGVGYVISLWPAGSRILKGLGLYEEFHARSEPMVNYRACDGSGRVLREIDFAHFTAEYGPPLGARRVDLMELLREGCADVDLRMNTTPKAIDPTESRVAVTLSDGTNETYDLVIGCDGIHSATRKLVFGEQPLNYIGWTGWAWWLDPALVPSDTVVEYWAAGRFLGLYPGKNSLCCFCAAPAPRSAPDWVESRHERLRATFGHLGGLVPQVVEGLPPGEDIWHDDFCDIKMHPWAKGRVLLIGDSGAAILPTAGVGASMAMESAAALADELSRADVATVDLAIRLFAKRRRPRVDRIQNASRRIAWLALVENRPLAWTRNRLMRVATENSILGAFKQMLETPF